MNALNGYKNKKIKFNAKIFKKTEKKLRILNEKKSI